MGKEGKGRGRKKKETYLRRIEKSKEWEEVVSRYSSGSKKTRRPFGEGGKRGIITYTYLHTQVDCDPVWPSGKAGKRKDLGSNLLRFSFLFTSCGLWTLSCDFVHHFLLKHLNAGIILVVTV